MSVRYGSGAVTVHAIVEPPHNFVEMHHYGNPDGLHYCPTGFAMCDGAHDPTCTEVRDFDGDCRKWGEA